MKRIAIIFIFSLFMSGISAQVFQTAYTLKPGAFSLGINPAIAHNDAALFLHGGYGLKQGMDLGVKLGLGWGEPYFGADLKWTMSVGMPSLAVSAGVHVHYNPGFDGTLNITFPLNSSSRLYTGLDADIVFADNIFMPVWVPIGLEVGIRQGMSVILEGSLGVTTYAPHIMNGGLVFYF